MDVCSLFIFFTKKKKNLYYFIHNQRFNTSSNEIIDVTCSFKKKIYILHEEASSYYQSFENRMGWVSWIGTSLSSGSDNPSNRTGNRCKTVRTGGSAVFNGFWKKKSHFLKIKRALLQIQTGKPKSLLYQVCIELTLSQCTKRRNFDLS